MHSDSFFWMDTSVYRDRATCDALRDVAPCRVHHHIAERMSRTASWTIRAYRAGDEAQVVALWNASYAPYAGLATRTIEDWRWAILARPGVDSEDIFLVEFDARLVGYAALWTGGKVLEFAVDPALRRAERRQVTERLLEGLEARTRERNWDSVDLMLPVCDRVIDRALRAAGYATGDGPAVIVRVLNPAQLVGRLLAARAERLWALRGQTWLIKLTAGDDPILLQRRLLLRLADPPEVVPIADEDAPSADAAIELTVAALAELVFCGSDAHEMLAAGRLRVEPPNRAEQACQLTAALAVETPWYTPWSDTF